MIVSDIILYSKRPATISIMTRTTAGPVAMRWATSKGNWLAGLGSGAGLGTGRQADHGLDCRLGLRTLLVHDFVRWASSSIVNYIF